MNQEPLRVPGFVRETLQGETKNQEPGTSTKPGTAGGSWFLVLHIGPMWKPNEISQFGSSSYVWSQEVLRAHLNSCE